MRAYESYVITGNLHDVKDWLNKVQPGRPVAVDQTGRYCVVIVERDTTEIKAKVKRPAVGDDSKRYTRYINHPVLGIVMWQNPENDPGMLTHLGMSIALTTHFRPQRMLGAGYVYDGVCVGDSESLGLRPSADDQDALTDAIRGRIVVPVNR